MFDFERSTPTSCGAAVSTAWSEFVDAVLTHGLCDKAIEKLVIRGQSFKELVNAHGDGIRVSHVASWAPESTVEPHIHRDFQHIPVDTFMLWEASMRSEAEKDSSWGEKLPPYVSILDYQVVCCHRQTPGQAYSESCEQCLDVYHEAWKLEIATTLLVKCVPPFVFLFLFFCQSGR